MRNLKKFLALVLAMMMTLSLMVTVNAADTKYGDMDEVIAEFQDDVTVLDGMGIIRGWDDEFHPQDLVTRAQMAAFIYRLKTGDYSDKHDNLYVNVNEFEDVDPTDWYAGYIGYCAEARIMEGWENKAHPDEYVTGYQALTMILRAMGANEPGHNFTGANFGLDAASMATSYGMLATVNKSSYAHSLSAYATRELVAELTFQGATTAQVQWTNAFGYQQYGMVGGVLGTVKNPSLGEQNYGLTHRTGIVVGNQATGEENTLVGFEAATTWNNATTPAITGVTPLDAPSYDYASGANSAGASLTHITTLAATDPGTNVTLSFNFETGLNYFGRLVTVWYDKGSNRDSAAITVGGVTVRTPSDYGKTYAILDNSVMAETVFADDLATNQRTANKTSVWSAAVDAGFSRNSAPTKISDRYSQIGAPSAANTATQSKVGMYTLISNNPNKTVDVVISLNQEVAQITQVNTSVPDAAKYIYLGKGNSKFGDTLNSGNGKILMDLLAPGADTNRGDVVVAKEIVGTTSTDGGSSDITSRAPATGTVNLATKYCRYMTEELKPAFTGTIATYKQGAVDTTNNPVVNVTLTDNKSYALSGITGAVEYASDTATHLIDGALTLLDNTNTYGGVTYDFYVDELGRFIGVGIPNGYTFLYGTYADYTMGGLGSADLKYYVSGFGWNANLIANEDLTTLNGQGMNGTRYNNLDISRKDLGTSSSGNEIARGYNKAYMIDGNGDMQDGTDTVGIYGIKFTGTADGQVPDTTNSNIRDWTITAKDASNGFARVKNHDGSGDIDYLLTTDTKFIVVSGIGINAKTTIYNGIDELVGSGSSAVISGDRYDGNKPGGAGVVNTDEVWFLTSDKQYGNVDTSKNNTITTVILSESNLTNYGTQTLYFSEPGNAATNVKLAGDKGDYGTVNQYKLYNNGVPNYYWVSDTLSGGNANGTAVKGDFYTLIQVGTISGQPIYQATNANGSSKADGNQVDVQYKYITVNDQNTAEIGTESGENIFKVGDATVTPAYGTNAAGGTFVETDDIDTVEKLNYAVSMGKDGTSGDLYYVYVAIVNNGVNVTNIYVTDVNTAQHNP